MSANKLENGKCDGLRHLDDDDLGVVTGGTDNKMVFCNYYGMPVGDGFYTTKEGCMKYDKSFQWAF
jgi:hypothetical protein